MSTFKMGFKNLFVFTALLLVWKVCSVYGQAARVEYINQPYTSSVATCSKVVVPAILTPVVLPYDSYIQDSVPTVPSYNGFNGYSNYAPSYPQAMPPIIIEDDDDDNWHHILFFLLFAMRNNRNCGSGNFGGYSGGYNGGCGCGGNCGGRCGNYGGYSNNNLGSGCSYNPYPIPYPMSGPYPYSFPGFGGHPDNSYGYIEEPYQTGHGNNDIHVYIRTDLSDN